VSANSHLSTEAAATAAAARAYIDALNSGDADRIVQHVGDDFVNEHTSAVGHGLVGRAAYRERLPQFLAEMQGLHYDVEDLIVDGDRCALPYRMTATWCGHPFAVRGVFRIRVRDGLIVHRVDYWDSLDFLRQTGRADKQ
jgi:ketosteroid isomerase-like protein